MKRYRVTFYCPDNHIVYDLNTLEKKGVGGGITARIRVAHALKDLGHRVTMIVNCPREQNLGGVEYRQLANVGKIETDILVLSTSGGNLDLAAVDLSTIQSKMKVLMLGGIEFPPNFSAEWVDFIHIPSNFIARSARENWPVAQSKLFVTHNGVHPQRATLKPISKDALFNLVYFSHPSKGLDAAVAILKILRKEDRRFTLHVFGGAQLWGQLAWPAFHVEGVLDHGMQGQQILARSLPSMGFSLNLQTRPEPFGMVITESMRAGSIVLASTVGAFSEIICNGFNGFLLQGDPADPGTHEKAAQLILTLQANPDYLAWIRQNAFHTPLDWKIIAQAWTGHWDWQLDGQSPKQLIHSGCLNCGGPLLFLVDGYHCIKCGNYQRSFDPAGSFDTTKG